MDALFDLDVIGAGLPFAAALDGLRRAVTDDGVAVVQAPPGTGKTTLVPPAMAELLPAGRIVVTQPRRVAARAAARRLAVLSGTRVGGPSGHTVRGDRCVGRDTRVEFVTPGVLVRRLIADPELPGVAAVVLDEVHERHLDSDLALALLCELRQLRDDLPVVAMSATVDARRFAALLGGDSGPAPVVDVPAVLYPLDVRYRPAPGPRLDARGVADAFLTHIADVTAAEHLATGYDALVFVPGVREIDRVCAALHSRLGGTGQVDVLPLHGGLTPAEQDRAVAGRGPGDRRRIVVSTDLAESSLTVPGVRLVVDGCLTREPRLDAARDMTGLVTVSASRDSCVQRAGRAARLAPGIAVRCVSEDDYARLPDHRTPAVETSDLTSFALDVACWGAPRGEGLPLPDAPPAAAIRRAEAALHGIGAVDGHGAATAHGRRLARIPVDPRLARALIDGADRVGPAAAAETVAVLAADRRIRGGDLVSELRALRSGRAEGARRWREESDRLRRLIGADRRGDDPPPVDAESATGLVVALAFPDRVACRRGEQYTLASGTGATLAPDSALRGHPWLAVAEVARAAGRAAGRTGAVIRAAAPIDRETAELAAAHLICEDVRAEFSGGRITARRVRRLGGIDLHSTPVAPTVGAVRGALAEALRSTGLDALRPDASAVGLHRRLSLLHRVFGDPWPAVDGPALAGSIDDWLGPEIPRIADGASLGSLDLSAALMRLLPWSHPQQAQRFDDLVPERLRVPSGARHRVEYPVAGSDDAPVLAVKLQECFGWRRSPAICDGRVPVTVHLLSPAGRPLAVTRDLAYFWSEAYPGVRAEMRGRYPRHPWPQDPMTAEATARTKPRG